MIKVRALRVPGRATLFACGFVIVLSHCWAESLPKITKEEVQASLVAESGAWAQAFSERSPHLYFSEAEWEVVRREVGAMTGPRGKWRDGFFERIDSVIQKPVPVYLSPEEMVGKRGDTKTLYSAKEELWEREVGDEIFALALAAKLKLEPRYTNKLRDLVLAALDFKTWGQTNPPMGNNADLAAGHLLRGIAAAYDWHRATFSKEEQEQIRQVVAERAPSLLAGLYGNAYWAGGYEENHNHVSVCGLAFAGAAFYDEIPAAPEWLAAARLNFQNVLKSLPADGSSVEGVSYWAYGIGYILQYIEGTRRVIDSAKLYESPFLRNAAAFRLMASTSGLEGNVPWGDAVLKDWGSPQYILNALATQYRDGSASWLAANLPNPQRASADALGLSMLWARNAPEPGEPPTELDARLVANDMVTTRNGWGPGDYLLSIKAGHTNRNHSHLDAGALALAFGDEWLLVAPGYGKGGGEGAFWDRSKSGHRWNFFSNSTESHATLLINGKNQRDDESAQATVSEFFSAPDWSVTTVDLTEAYRDVSHAERQVVHRRGEYILVFDSVTAPQPVSVEWLAQFRKETPPDKQGDLLARGTKGRVLIRLLDPSGTFSLRAPLSPKVDPPKPQFTYAAKSEGTSVQFTVLLQPVASGSPAPSLKTRAETIADGTQRIEISAVDWNDQIARAPDRREFVFTASGENPARVTAQFAGIRATSKGVDSFVAINAIAVDLPGFLFRAEKPCDLAARKNSDGLWEVVASRDIASELPKTATQTSLPSAKKNPQ